VTLLSKLPKVKDVAAGQILDLDVFAERWNGSFEFSFVDPADLTAAERAVFGRTADIV
jgi:hypothetical protein